jgi:hypothetical protein
MTRLISTRLPVRASETWRELAQDFPNYAPAPVNLMILKTSDGLAFSHSAGGGRASLIVSR